MWSNPTAQVQGLQVPSLLGRRLTIFVFICVGVYKFSFNSAG